MKTLSVDELKQRLADSKPIKLIDVREPWEHEQAVIEQAVKMPMDSVPEHLEQLQTWAEQQELAVICKSGGRSGQIVAWLEQNELSSVYNVMGGMDAWQK